MLVATNYFTKWSEAVPLKNMTHREVIEFITEHIIHRLAKQNDISVVDYHDLMMDNIDEVTDKRLKALKKIEKDKLWVARAYNKKVKLKSFQVGDLVWKTILPIGMKSNKFGKWSPSWEGPYKIIKVISGNSYMVETVQGERPPRAINGWYLKKFYPNV